MNRANFHASTELHDKTQVGVFASQNFGKEGKLNFGIGIQKKINEYALLKAKLDKNLHATVFSDLKCTDTPLSLQSTVSKQFSGEEKQNGFLGSAFSIGLKLKYDS